MCTVRRRRRGALSSSVCDGITPPVLLPPSFWLLRLADELPPLVSPTDHATPHVRAQPGDVAVGCRQFPTPHLPHPRLRRPPVRRGAGGARDHRAGWAGALSPVSGHHGPGGRGGERARTLEPRLPPTEPGALLCRLHRQEWRHRDRRVRRAWGERRPVQRTGAADHPAAVWQPQWRAASVWRGWVFVRGYGGWWLRRRPGGKRAE